MRFPKLSLSVVFALLVLLCLAFSHWSGTGFSFPQPAAQNLTAWQTLQQGHFPFWTENLFNGYPLYSEGRLGIFEPLHILCFTFLPLKLAPSFLALAYLLCAGLAMTSLVGRLTVNSKTAFFAGLNYILVSFLLLHLNLPGLLCALTYLPLAFLFAHKAIARVDTYYAALAGLAVALLVQGGALPLGFYVLLSLLCFYPFLLFSLNPQYSWGHLARQSARYFMVTLNFSLGLTGILLFPALEFIPFLANIELPSTFWPLIFSQLNYFSLTPLLVVYSGISILLLASLIHLPPTKKLWYLSTAFLTLTLALSEVTLWPTLNRYLFNPELQFFLNPWLVLTIFLLIISISLGFPSGHTGGFLLPFISGLLLVLATITPAQQVTGMTATFLRPHAADYRFYAPDSENKTDFLTNLANFSGPPNFIPQRQASYLKNLTPTLLRLAGVRYLLEPLPKDANYQITEMPAFPPAWLVSSFKVAPSAPGALSYLTSAEFQPLSEVVLEEAPTYKSHPSREFIPVLVTKLSPTLKRLRVSIPEAKILVLRDTYSPGWRVNIDDQPARLYRANFLFQAVIVPAGEHRIDFEYFLLSFYLGLVISLLFFFALVTWTYDHFFLLPAQEK